jgi:hypothetical protein
MWEILLTLKPAEDPEGIRNAARLSHPEGLA